MPRISKLGAALAASILTALSSSAHGDFVVSVHPVTPPGTVVVTGASVDFVMVPPFPVPVPTLFLDEDWTGSSLDATLRIVSTVEDFEPGSGWLIRVVNSITNNSGEAWISFDLELQSIHGMPSPDDDGLSFSQSTTPREFWITCDLLPTFTEVSDVRDYINFSGGTVLPGQTVTMTYLMSGNQPAPEYEFYLRQRPNFIPAPGAAALFGVVALLVRRRRASTGVRAAQP